MSIYDQYVAQVFRGQLDHYTPYDGHYGAHDSKDENKRPTPHGLSDRDQKILLSVRKSFHFLDEAFHICGIYFGWSFILAFFFPLIGPAIEFILSYNLIIRRAERADIPKWLKSDMMTNVLLGTALSMIPFLGRILVALFGPNKRNERLFEEYLRIRGDTYVKLRGSGPFEMEKLEGNEWWKELSTKAGGSVGVTGKDVEQIKPGAGMTVEEVQQGYIGAGSPGGPADQA